MTRGARFSLDANLLVYTARGGDWRQPLAVSTVERSIMCDCILTLQALGEFYTACTRKGYATRSEAAAQVRRWLGLFPGVAAASAETVDAALPASAAGRLGYWDALLLATAAEAGCGAVISEDMTPGVALHGARVFPAFAGDRVSPEALALLGDGPHASL